MFAFSIMYEFKTLKFKRRLNFFFVPNPFSSSLDGVHSQHLIFFVYSSHTDVVIVYESRFDNVVARRGCQPMVCRDKSNSLLITPYDEINVPRRATTYLTNGHVFGLQVCQLRRNELTIGPHTIKSHEDSILLQGRESCNNC